MLDRSASHVDGAERMGRDVAAAGAGRASAIVLAYIGLNLLITSAPMAPRPLVERSPEPSAIFARRRR